MTVVTDFVAELKGLSAITDVSATVTPMVSKGKFPAIVYTALDGIRDSFYIDSFGLRTTQIDVSVYATSYTQLQSLKSGIIEKFHGFSGTLNSDSVVSSIKATNTLETYETGTEPLYRAIIQFDLID